MKTVTQKSETKNLTNGAASEQFTPMQLEAALLSLDDLMERCSIPDRYFLLGETAKAVRDNLHLTGSCIEAGVEERYLSENVRSIIKLFTNVDNIVDNFEFEASGIPIRVKVIKNDYDFFKYPDVRVYGPEEYQIPNPFKEYYQMRGLIR